MLRVIGIAVAVAAILIVGVVGYFEITEKTAEQRSGPAPGQEGGDQVASAYSIDRQARKLVFDRNPTPDECKKAEAMFRESLEKFRKHKAERGEAEVLNDFGILYSEQGRFSEAERYFKRLW